MEDPPVATATAVADLDDPFLVETALTTWNTVHDKYQFESAFDFDLRPQNGEKNRRYEIDMYVFVPTSIGINSTTYSRDQFYADLTSHMRLRTPHSGFGREHVEDQLVLPAADEYLQVHLPSRRRHKLAKRVVAEVKLFGCVVNTRLKDLVAPVARGAGTVVLQIEDLRVRLLAISELLEGYRNRYLCRLKAQPILLDEEVERAFWLVDEFLSARLDWIVIALQERFIAESNAPADLLVWLDVVLRNEHAYRKEAGLITLEDGPGRSQRLEQYYYRFGLLKKYVTEVLYLRARHLRRDSLYRNLVAVFGAGLAALFAALADLQRVHVGGGRDSILRLMAVIIVGVIVYVFKDRIKELTKEYFNERLKRFLPDYVTRLGYEHVTPQGERITTQMGAAREFMRYLNRESIPPDIQYLREIENRSKLDPERMDVIFHYARHLNFHLDALRSTIPHARHIKNIVRFDISEFLAKLDDPKQPLAFYDPSRGVSHIAAPKVYHVNVVFRYAVERMGENGRSGQHVEYERIRVVLNKKGIRRIETVVPRGELSYETGA